MRFYRFRIKKEDGITLHITRRADNFIKLLGQLFIEYPKQEINYIG